MSWRAVMQMNAQSNDAYYSVPIKVLSAQQQVVAGINYKLKVLVGKSQCLKNLVLATDLTSSNCQAASNGPQQVCTFTVWVKSWENFEEIKLVSCEPSTAATATGDDETAAASSDK